MPKDQDKIYYITASSYNAAKNSPHLEIFKKKGLEVILLSDRVDEWLVSYLNEFDGKPLQSISKGKIDIDEKPEDKKVEKTFESVIKQLKEVLKESMILLA